MEINYYKTTIKLLLVVVLFGLTENDGHENEFDGPSKIAGHSFVFEVSLLHFVPFSLFCVLSIRFHNKCDI